jgi:hypothetical protein
MLHDSLHSLAHVDTVIAIANGAIQFRQPSFVKVYQFTEVSEPAY